MRSLTTTTWCPSSSQLRFALNCGRNSTVAVRVRRLGFRKLDHRCGEGIRVCSVAGAGNGRTVSSSSEKEERCSGNSNSSWTSLNNSTDGFAGWSGSEQSGDGSERKESIGGTVGAALSGVLLVAGLTFAALSMGRKSSSRVEQQMEPLTVQQETSLASNDHERISEEENGKGLNDIQEIGNGESKTGMDNDTSLYVDDNEVESNVSDNINSRNTSGDTNIQGELLKKTAEGDTSVDSEDTSKLTEPEGGGDSFAGSSFQNKDGNLSESKDDGSILINSESAAEPRNVDFANQTDLSKDDGSVLINSESAAEPRNVDFANQTDLSASDDTLMNFTSTHQQEVSGLQEAESSQVNSALEPMMVHEVDKERSISLSVKEGNEQTVDNSVEQDSSPQVNNLNKAVSSGSDSISPVVNPSVNELDNNGYNLNNVSEILESTNSGNFFTSAGLPAPSLVSEALQAPPGKVLVPAVVDQVQGEALTALQVLKVIEADVQPGDLCTRREYARWLVSASSALSRNTISKVYPAMYIENVSELAFDDITPDDPDFPSIQGLAEAGLISSKLSRRDLQSSVDEEEDPLYFSPESPLSRQDLVSWKMSLERKQLPVVNRKIMEQICGFIDIDKIHPDAWPALVADLAVGEQGVIALAFGYIRLFQPDKPVTKAQAAVALATAEASDIVNEELARIEAESIAEKAVAAHSELVAQVEKDINSSFEKELTLEREKIDMVERLADETRHELDRLKAKREEENLVLMKERAAVNSEMEVLSRLRSEMEEQLQEVMSNKVEISYEKERLNKLREDAENKNKELSRLQYELEVERKALSMARAWAEDEAKRAREQAKVLEEARGRWVQQGIKVIVDDDLREEADASATWVNASKELSTVEGTVDRAESLVDRLKIMADVVTGRSKDTINLIIQKILSFTSLLKDRALKASQWAGELKDAAFSKMSSSLQEMQQHSAEFTSTAKEGIKRIIVDCKEGVGKFTQKFKEA